MTYTLYKISTGESVKSRVPYPRTDGGEIVGLHPDYVYLLEIQEEKPVYDATTDKLVRGDPIIDLRKKTITFSWNVEKLKQKELDLINSKKDIDLAKGLYDDLKKGVGTPTERLERLENVVARLLKVYTL